MNPEHWQRLKSVLDQVIGLEGSERDSVVHRFCAQHPELEDELRSLLRDQETRTGAGDSMTLALRDATRGPGRLRGDLPEWIGSYRIVSKLGEGGMGVVYEAEQANPRRKVAVKVVRGGQFVDEHRARSFRREAETLARLKHPGIAAIFESGRTEDGQHFFAMELVHGTALDEFVAQRPKLVDETELRFRLALFRKIADAVHYAHQRGVIHRDLKPSNIFVTEPVSSGAGPPEIKVLDFGLARITEGDVAGASMTTEIGLIKGTLAYMAPEQALGDPDRIDLRCDVYALGVILYEMLCARRPYDVSRKSLAEAVRLICEQPPASLRQSWSGRRRLDPDIETIVLRALEKDADRRYSSTAALADDVSRYLTSQPILARPPSTIYQLRKFAARNRALVGGVVATFVVLIAGVVASSFLGLREAAQRRQAEAARNDLQAVSGFQAAMLRSVDPHKMGQALQLDLIRRMSGVVDAADRDVVDRAFGKINPTDAALRILDEDILARAATSIEKEFAEKPRIAAQLYLSLSETYRVLGLLAPAERFATRSIELREAELGRNDVQTLWARSTLSSVMERQGRLAESEAESRRVLEIARRTLGDDHDLILATKNLLAIACDRQNKHDEAERLYQSVYDAYRVKLGEDHTRTIWLLHNVAAARRLGGRPDDAEPPGRAAVSAFTRTLGPDHHDTLWGKLTLTFILVEQRKLGEAEQLAREIEEKRRRLLGDEHQETLEAQSLLGLVYLEQGRLRAAEPILRDSLEGSRRVIGSDHRDTVFAIVLLARALGGQGRYEEALPLLEEAYRARRRVLGDDDKWTRESRAELLEVYTKLGRHSEAKALTDPT